jgi:large subunit ribosomal protein L19
MSIKIIKELEESVLKTEVPVFQVGDTVQVKVLIREGNKERNQNFEGMVIATKGGGVNATFTVRRIFQGIAIERTFMLHSPKVVSVKVMRKGKTRRAKLYYMRERIGTKSTRLKEDSTRIAKDFQEKLIQQEKKESEKASKKSSAQESSTAPDSEETVAATA